MHLDILYFSWVREGVGHGSERREVPDGVATVADLIDWLGYPVLADRNKLRAAVDQVFVSLDAPLDGAREVAIFPPVTGG